jgi:hypothetical protein
MARDLICITVENKQAIGESVPCEKMPVQLHSVDVDIA